MGPRKTIWARCHTYFKPSEKDFVRVSMKEGKVLTQDMKDWIEEHKDQTFRVRKVSGESVALQGVSFAVSLDLLELPLCMED